MQEEVETLLEESQSGDSESTESQQEPVQQQPKPELIDGIFPDQQSKEWAQRAYAAARAEFEQELTRLKAEPQPPPQQPASDPALDVKKAVIEKFRRAREDLKRTAKTPEDLSDGLLYTVFDEVVRTIPGITREMVIRPEIADSEAKREFFQTRPDLMPYRDKIVDLVERYGVPRDEAVGMFENVQRGTVETIRRIGQENPHYLAWIEEPNARSEPVANPEVSELRDQIVKAWKNEKTGEFTKLVKRWKNTVGR